MLLVIFSQESPLAWDISQGLVVCSNDWINLINKMQYNTTMAGQGKAIFFTVGYISYTERSSLRASPQQNRKKCIDESTEDKIRWL